MDRITIDRELAESLLRVLYDGSGISQETRNELAADLQAEIDSQPGQSPEQSYWTALSEAQERSDLAD